MTGHTLGLVLLAAHPGRGTGHPIADSGGPSNTVTFSVAAVAAVAGIVAAIIAFNGVKATNRASKTAAQRDYALRQLNEFYGPIQMRRRLSERLHVQLKDSPSPDRWMLVEHIAEIQADSDDRRQSLVRQILRINKELSKIILDKGGLIESGKPPTVYTDFLEHAATLRYWWDKGEDAVEPGKKPFPQGFDDATNQAVTALQKKLETPEPTSWWKLF